MSITNEYVDLFTYISSQISLPNIKSIYLPKPVEDSEQKDDFGFVILDDNSAGAFYCNLENTLEQLKDYYSKTSKLNEKASGLIEKLRSNSIPDRAVALGVINAISQHIFHHARFSPPDKKTANTSSTGISHPKAGERMGMIGYFSPLIERLLEKNIEVLVVEKNPARVVSQKGVKLTENMVDLNRCDHILCTASTLINNTLDEVLENSKQSKSFSLIGPSGSSLPDILFNHGVDAVGGFHVDDVPALQQALMEQQSWGHTGNKYQLTSESYPGIEALLKRYRA